MSRFLVSEAYAARPQSFLGLRVIEGYTLKQYAIVYGSAPLERQLYEPQLLRAVADLPQPAVAVDRPGVGFAIFHQGRGVHYLVLCVWQRENELPMRVYTRSLWPGEEWTGNFEGFGPCVWDLQVIEFERSAYVREVMGAPGVRDLSAYLAAIAPNV